MHTTVAFAGNLTDAPEPHHTRENDPFFSCRVLVNRRAQNDAGESLDVDRTSRNVTIFGPAATHVHDSGGSADTVFVHGLERTEAWADKESGEKRTREAVVDNRFGEVGVSLKYVSDRVDRAPRRTRAS